MHLKLLNHTSNIVPLENEKLIFVNQNDVKVKGRGHFLKTIVIQNLLTLFLHEVMQRKHYINSIETEMMQT